MTQTIRHAMTKAEAKAALAAGQKVTHLLFPDGEYIFLKDEKVHDEVGLNIDERFWALRAASCWDEGWEIFTPAIQEKDGN